MSTANPTQVVFTSTITGALAQISFIVVRLITIPIIITQLGKTEYGLWVLIGQSISFMALSELGISNAISRFVARDKVTRTQEDLNTLINTGVGLSLVVANLVVLISIGLIFVLPNWLGVEPAYLVSVRWVLLISGISLSIQIPLRISFGILNGYQKYGVTNTLQIGLSLFNLVGVLLLLWTDQFGLILLGVVYFSASVFYHLSGLIAIKRTFSGIRIFIRDFSKVAARELLGVGLSASLITAGSSFYRQGIVLASGKLLSIEEAGIYGFVLGLITLLTTFLTQLTLPLLTLASEVQAKEDLNHLERIMNRTMRITFSLGGSAAVGIFFYGEEILRLWLRSSDWSSGEFHMAWLAMVVMGIGLAVGLPQLASRSILQGVGRHWQVTAGFFAASLSALILSIVLMRNGLGITGAALGWALVLFLQGTVIYPPLITRFFNVKWWKMFPKAYFPGIIICSALALTCYLMKTLVPPTTVGLLALNVLVGLLVSGAGFFIISGLSLRQFSQLLQESTPWN
jgi:O-antigen/teichoic acid export membrane protein